MIDHLPDGAPQIVAAGVAGGIGSEIAGGRFEDGFVTGLFSRAFNDYLHFNGKKLTWFDDDGNAIKKWDAVSGRLDENGNTIPENQNIPNNGPTPEGKYSVDPSESNYDAWYKRDWGSHDAWGDVRTPLDPYPDTNTFGKVECTYMEEHLQDQ